MEPDGVVDEADGGWRGDCLKEDGRKYPSKTNKNTNKECKHQQIKDTFMGHCRADKDKQDIYISSAKECTNRPTEDRQLK